MYTFLNGLLPDIMSELYMVNNEVHDHLTRQSHFLHTIKGNNHDYILSFNNTGPRIRNCLQKKINVIVPIAKLKKNIESFFPGAYT